MHMKSREFILRRRLKIEIHILSAQSFNVSDPTSYGREETHIYIACF